MESVLIEFQFFHDFDVGVDGGRHGFFAERNGLAGGLRFSVNMGCGVVGVLRLGLRVALGGVYFFLDVAFGVVTAFFLCCLGRVRRQDASATRGVGVRGVGVRGFGGGVGG